VPAAAMQSRLHDRFGSRGEGVGGVGRYRALYASEGGEYKAFRVVPGAVVRGGADPGATVRVSTAVEIEGAAFTYERAVTAENGSFAVRVPYPGDYEITGAGVSEGSVSVPDAAVRNGTDVVAGSDGSSDPAGDGNGN